MITLKKKLKATKCSDHGTTSFTARTGKILPRILIRRIERKIVDVIGDQFGFRGGKGTTDAIGTLRIK